MIDPNTEIRAMLLSSTAASITALVSTRVYQGLLPRGYQIADPAITFFIRGGATDPDIPMIEQSVGFNCWADSAAAATEVAGALADFLLSSEARTACPHVMRIAEEIFGTARIDPDCGWDYVQSFYNFLFMK